MLLCVFGVVGCVRICCAVLFGFGCGGVGVGSVLLVALTALLFHFLFYQENGIGYAAHRTVGGLITKGKLVVDANDHGGGAAAVKFKCIFCAKSSCKQDIVLAGADAPAGLTSVHYAKEACAVLLKANKGSGGVCVATVIGVAVGVYLIVVDNNVIAAYNPGAALILPCGNFNQVNGIAINVLCKYRAIFLGINNCVLSAVKLKVLGSLNPGSGHCVVGSPNGILIEICRGRFNDHNACVGDGVSTWNVVDRDLACGGLLIIFIYFELLRLAVGIINNETGFNLCHSANCNLSVVIKADTIFVCHVALADDDSVVNVGVNVRARGVKIVTVGCKHHLASCLCLIVLGNIHYVGQSGVRAFSDAVDNPFVLCILAGGIVLTVKDLLV